MSNDAAGFASRCGPLSCSPTWAFDAGLRPGPFPSRAASLLPGSLAITRTGLTPAGDDELPIKSQPLDDHLLITGRTPCSTSCPSVSRCRPTPEPAPVPDEAGREEAAMPGKAVISLTTGLEDPEKVTVA